MHDSEDDGFIQQSQGRLHYANFEADDEDHVVRLVVYVLEDYDSQQWTLKHSAEAEYVLRWRSSNNLARDFEFVTIHPDCDLHSWTGYSRGVFGIRAIVLGVASFAHMKPFYTAYRGLKLLMRHDGCECPFFFKCPAPAFSWHPEAG
ncbi:unnamed protein product [Urochloa humidicola]